MRSAGAILCRARGFTILEVVLAMAILFVGMTAVLGFLSVGAALARTAALRGDAAAAAEAVVADLEEHAFPTPPGADPLSAVPGEPRAFVERPVPGHPGLTYTATLTPEPDPAPGRPPLWRVDVEIAWRSAGLARSRRFTTLLTGEIPFGERLRRAFLGAGDAAAPTASPAGEPSQEAHR